MKTFLVCMGMMIFTIGLALTAIPVDAQVILPSVPPPLTPFPTLDWAAVPAEQRELQRHLNDAIWWECARFLGEYPCVVSNPRPGMVLFIIQAWRWVMDTGVGIVFMNGVVLGVVLFIVLRLAYRFKSWGEKGTSVSGGEIKVSTSRDDIAAHNRSR